MVSLSHPCERITIAGDNEGLNTREITLHPRQTVSVKLLFSPDRRERIVEPVSIAVEENPTLVVPIQAFSGLCSYTLDGEVKFVNMMVGEVQTILLHLNNTGDIAFPFEVTLEPAARLANTFTVVVSTTDRVLKAGSKPVDIEITASPTRQESIEAVIYLRFDLGRGPVVREFPVKFYAYKDPVILSDDANHDFGRVCTGDSDILERELLSFDVRPMQYRFVKTVMQTPADASEYLVQSQDATGQTTPATALSRVQSASSRRPVSAKPASNPDVYEITQAEGRWGT